MRAFRRRRAAELAAYLDGLIDAHHPRRPDIVRVTTMFAQNVASVALARRIKLRNPQAVIVFGGANCEAPIGRELATHVDVVDFAFSGPRCARFRSLVGQSCAPATPTACTVSTACSRRRTGRAHRRVHACRLGGRASTCGSRTGWAELDVDTTIALDYDEFQATLRSQFPDPPMQSGVDLETSRGCWWASARTARSAASTPIRWESRDGIRARGRADPVALQVCARTSRLDAVDNIMPKSYLRGGVPNLHTPENLTIFYEVKADLSDAEPRRPAEARVHSCSRASRRSRRPRSADEKGHERSGKVRFLKDCVRHGIYPEWNLLVGFLVRRARLRGLRARSAAADASAAAVGPSIRFVSSFSPYHTKAGEFGLDLHPYDFYSLVYPFPSARCRTSPTTHRRNFAAPYITTTAKWIAVCGRRSIRGKARWHGSSQGADTPRLFLKEDASGARVSDSRRGDASEYPLTPAQRRILERSTPAPAPIRSHRGELPIDAVVAGARLVQRTRPAVPRRRPLVQPGVPHAGHADRAPTGASRFLRPARAGGRARESARRVPRPARHRVHRLTGDMPSIPCHPPAAKTMSMSFRCRSAAAAVADRSPRSRQPATTSRLPFASKARSISPHSRRGHEVVRPSRDAADTTCRSWIVNRSRSRRPPPHRRRLVICVDRGRGDLASA